MPPNITTTTLSAEMADMTFLIEIDMGFDANG